MLLGHDLNSKPINLHVDRTIETRLLITSNSGGGKSYVIRRVLEQTHGQVQQIVIDVEDEFLTLREKYDYVLAGSKGSDCPAHPGCAAMLARKLLELRVSAIVGIYELQAHERIRFVRYFLDALVNAPKELWHPALIVVDEAHIFAPQTTQAESAGAVIDLMTRGRKRGFCGILATQRISKLHKDAAAECNNKLIGRCALDVDMHRAADELGFTSRDERLQLRNLQAGNFFCFGPALTQTVTQIHIAAVGTSHPKPGQHAAAPPPARATVQKILGQLADLPAEAEQEARTVAELQKQVRDLQRQVAAKPIPAALPAPKPVEIQIFDKKALEQIVDLKAHLSGVAGMTADLTRKTTEFITLISERSKPKNSPLREMVDVIKRGTMPKISAFSAIMSETDTKSQPVTIGKCERAILTVLAQSNEDGCSKIQVSIISGYSIKSSGFQKALCNLRVAGCIFGSDQFNITPEGIKALGPWTPLPTGGALADHWISRLGKCEAAILKVLIDQHDDVEKNELARLAGYSPTSSGFQKALCNLRVLKLASGSTLIRASDLLYGV